MAKYNELFNSTRPREYDGSHIHFVGMNPDITLRPHQRNAIAHVLYGGNTLLAHEVGARKTFEMAASAMESKRLGLCQKSMFVVPNHLTQQWANEFLRLYPSAKLLVTTKKILKQQNGRNSVLVLLLGIMMRSLSVTVSSRKFPSLRSGRNGSYSGTD
ncbi:MAG: DEAD/DEAH box helicase family protein [Faecalibacterium prausnitzii]